MAPEINDFTAYQRAARETAIYPKHLAVIYPTLGLAGEVGEVAEKVKKIYRDDGGEITKEKRAALVKELGDVLWYLATLAGDLGIDLGDVAEENLKKLRDRAERKKLQGSGDSR